jgi:hypothetical protein
VETLSLNLPIATYINQRLKRSYLIATLLVILSGSYLALAGSTIGLTTVQWDEFTDLVIASELSQHPLSGHSYDGSQARFPMYITAVAYRFMQIADPHLELLDMLPFSRWFSMLMTVLAIWGTYILGSRLFNTTTGMLAATLFTFSPFVLQFGRAALTQGDAFTSATVVFTLITFEQFNSKRTTFWLACFSFCLALAIAAKFFLAILIPAFITYQVMGYFGNRRRQPDVPVIAIETKEVIVDWPFTFLAVGTGLFALLALIIALLRFEQSAATNHLMYQVARLLWGMTLLGILLSLIVAFKNSRVWLSRSVKVGNCWHLHKAWLAILPLTFAITLALFPAHIFNPHVLPTLFDRFITMDGNSNLLATSIDSAKLYLGLILLKLGLPLGIATCFALFWAGQKSIHNKAFLLLTVILFYYGLLLAVLPLQQPFWLMSIYPLIVVILAAMIAHGLTHLKPTILRVGWAAYVALGLGWLIVGLLQVYPTFGFYGYELISGSWLGDSSRGYSAVVVVTNDGSTEAIDWLRRHASSGELVISYLDDPHIINYLDSAQPFAFELRQADQYQAEANSDQGFTNADFVVTRALDDTFLSAPVTDPAFIQLFGTEPAHQIMRGRGVYRMPVIQIFQRNSETS